MRKPLTSEAYLARDLNACVAACERYLRSNPRDQRIRERLNSF